MKTRRFLKLRLRRLIILLALLTLAAVVLIAACARTVDEPPMVGEPPPPSATPQLRPETITTGGHHSCGLTERGSAYCWGWNGEGQLGVGDENRIDRHYPTAVAGGLTFAQISAGGSHFSAGGGHTCSLTTDGAAYCWGRNAEGQLGDGTTTRHLVPQPVAGGLSFTQISVGGSHTCALSATGAVYCWGSNYSGQLGDGTTTIRTAPTASAELVFKP
jgi:alpha-tubulin suppressor-like RCC1 family protein